MNLLGNIVLFIPCGVYAEAVQKRRRFAKTLFALSGIFIAVELIQFMFGLGVGDIDDVLLNTLGGLIGVLGYTLLGKGLKDEERAKTVTAALSLFVGVPAICLYFATLLHPLR